MSAYCDRGNDCRHFHQRPPRPDVRQAFSVRNGNHASLLELVTPESRPGINVIGTIFQEQVLTVIYRLYLTLVLITTLTFSQIESTKMSDWAIANSLYAFYIYQCHRSQSSWVEHWGHNNFREFSAKPRCFLPLSFNYIINACSFIFIYLYITYPLCFIYLFTYLFI